MLKGSKTLVNEHTGADITSPTQVKVKVSYALLGNYDALLFSGAVRPAYPKTIGRAAVGIVTEAGENCYGVEKGMRVYFEPTRACGECVACRSGKPRECRSVTVAGKDFDGFLRDFVVCEYTEVAPLPDSVGDLDALCIETVGIAENIYDKLNLSAGQRVAVVGGNFTGNIIAQVLQYHKVVPIIIDNNPANLERAKKCGIYYNFSADDDLEANILNATGGHLCDAAVYCASSGLNMSLSTRLVGAGRTVVLCSHSAVSSSLDAYDILDKNLTVFGVSDAYDYTDAVINMFIHGAVNTDVFEKEVLTEYDPVKILTEMCSKNVNKNKLTIIKMIL